MRPLTVTFDENTLAQFTPQVQEALWRLARQEEPPQDLRTPSERLRVSITRGPSEADIAKRVAQFQHPDGVSIIEKTALRRRS